ncbi:MAG: hypothetical protein WCT32_02695 [Patescibacteria group bacterium]|jgi:hypothetical protein
MKSFARKAAGIIAAFGLSLTVAVVPTKAQQPLLTATAPMATNVVATAVPESTGSTTQIALSSPAIAPNTATPPIAETPPNTELDNLKLEIRSYRAEVEELRTLVREQNKLLQQALPTPQQRVPRSALAGGTLTKNTLPKAGPAGPIPSAPVVPPPTKAYTTQHEPTEATADIPATRVVYSSPVILQTQQFALEQIRDTWKEIRAIKAQPLGGRANQETFLSWMRKQREAGKLAGIVEPMGQKEIVFVVNQTIETMKKQGVLSGIGSPSTAPTPEFSHRIGGRAILALLIIFSLICSFIFFLLNPEPKPLLKQPKGKIAEFWVQMSNPVARFQTAIISAFVALMVVIGIGWPLFKP